MKKKKGFPFAKTGLFLTLLIGCVVTNIAVRGIKNQSFDLSENPFFAALMMDKVPSSSIDIPDPLDFTSNDPSLIPNDPEVEVPEALPVEETPNVIIKAIPVKLPDQFLISKGQDFTLEEIGMEMIWVDPIGSWVAQSEVTQKQFARGGIDAYHKFEGEDRAHDSATWDQAIEFCQKLTRNEAGAGRLPVGFVYTLPTEDQWKIFVGDAGLQHAVYGRSRSAGPLPPGTKPKNQYGLVDVRGNLWEWMLNDFSRSNKAKGKALRGGSFMSDAALTVNPYSRFYGQPDNPYYQYGFRFVLTPDK